MDQKTRAAILALPHAHHPRLQPLVTHLANRAGIDFQMALSLLEEMRKELQISTMDVEFARPGAAPTVRFVAMPTSGPVTDYQAQVAAHLRRIVGDNACP